MKWNVLLITNWYIAHCKNRSCHNIYNAAIGHRRSIFHRMRGNSSYRVCFEMFHPHGWPSILVQHRGMSVFTYLLPIFSLVDIEPNEVVVMEVSTLRAVTKGYDCERAAAKQVVHSSKEPTIGRRLCTVTLHNEVWCCKWSCNMHAESVVPTTIVYITNRLLKQECTFLH